MDYGFFGHTEDARTSCNHAEQDADCEIIFRLGINHTFDMLKTNKAAKSLGSKCPKSHLSFFSYVAGIPSHFFRPPKTKPFSKKHHLCQKKHQQSDLPQEKTSKKSQETPKQKKRNKKQKPQNKKRNQKKQPRKRLCCFAFSLLRSSCLRPWRSLTLMKNISSKWDRRLAWFCLSGDFLFWVGLLGFYLVFTWFLLICLRFYLVFELVFEFVGVFNRLKSPVYRRGWPIVNPQDG